MKISVKVKGNYSKVRQWLNRIKDKEYLNILDRYGKRGVDALRFYTPKDTGKTADSWGYEIHHTQDTTTITWTNDNINNGVSIAVILQYGHGTGTGGYVQGVDYINPAMGPVFDEISKELWEEVSRI